MSRGKAPAAENAPSKDYTLNLGSGLKASYDAFMIKIEADIVKMNEQEMESQPAGDKLELMYQGRPCTPSTSRGTFVLILVPPPDEPAAKTVVLLIQWHDLYIKAFYVEGVWYYFKDKEFSTSMLPPQSQFPHNPKDGVGRIKLPFKSSYKGLGGFTVKVGEHEFTRCVFALGKLGQLYSTEAGIKELQAGPLAFPVLVISEAIRFGRLRAWASTQFGAAVGEVVPEAHTGLLNSWEQISKAVVKGKSWGKLTLAELVQIIRVLKRTSEVKPQKVRWAPGASSSGSKKK